jgi:4-hydroxyphenylpyruvate dioxygenase-like putative hemolysin
MSNVIDLKTLRPSQLGYVYKDIEEPAQKMERFLGASKFIIFEPVEVDITYRGVKKKIIMKSGFGKIFDTEIELLQPIEGDSIYTEFLNEGRGGLHHISYKVEDVSSYIEEFKKLGIKVLQWGLLIKLVYVYLDTEEFFDIIIEFTEELKRGGRKNLNF